MNDHTSLLQVSPVRALTQAAQLLTNAGHLAIQPYVTTGPDGRAWMRWALDLNHNAGPDVNAQLAASVPILDAFLVEWTMTQNDWSREWHATSGLVELEVIVRRPMS